MIAGGDEKLLSEINRFKSANDIGKELLRQKQELSKRAAGGAFPKEGTPEAQTEWRKANGVPEAGTLEAYGIKAPEGYQMSKGEEAAYGALAQAAHGMNLPSTTVQSLAGLLFKSNQAMAEGNAAMDKERSQEWSAALTKEFGKDTETYVKAGGDYISQLFGDDEQGKTMFLNARLPGGGRLGDHPVFAKMAIDLALKNGLTDRIETQQLEGSGASLRAQREDIEKLRTSDPAKYNRPETQSRYERILDLMHKRGEIDDQGRYVGRI